MTVKTRAELNAEADADLLNNSTRLISPTDVRQTVKNLADSNINRSTDATAFTLDFLSSDDSAEAQGKLGLAAAMAAAIADQVPIFESIASAEAAEIPVTRDDVIVDGVFYKVVGSEPTHDGWFLSANGNHYEVAEPSEFETVPLTHFLRRHPNDHPLAFKNACLALFNDITRTGGVLDCEEIPITLTETLRIGHETYDFNTTENQGKIILRPKFKASGSWTTGDYLFSMAGNTDDSKRISRLKIVDGVFDCAGKLISGLHLCGFYEPHIIRPVVKNCKRNCIVATAYDLTTGVGIPVDTVTYPYSESHGLKVEEPNLDDETGTTDDSVGIYNETPDFDFAGGHFDYLKRGMVIKCAQGNIKGGHYSLQDAADGFMRVAIQLDFPQGVEIDGPELDGSYILMRGATDHLHQGGDGVALSTWRNVVVKNIKWGGSRKPPSSYGLVTMDATVASTVAVGFDIGEGGWTYLTGFSANEVPEIEWASDGVVGKTKWSVSAASPYFKYRASHNVLAAEPADFPTGTKVPLSRLIGDKGWRLDTDLGRLEGRGPTTTSGNRHYMEVDGNTLIIGKQVASVDSDRMLLDANGNVVFSMKMTATGGIEPAGGFTVSPRLMRVGSNLGILADQTPVNTEVYIGEVFVPVNVTVTGVALLNGSAVAGNVKVGLADSAGAVVATSASTAQAGTSVHQRVPFTGAYAAKGPATYYALVIFDTNTTPRFGVHTGPDNFGAAKQTGQVFATGFTTITPPTTFTVNLAPMASLY